MADGLRVQVLGPVLVGVGDAVLPLSRLLERGLLARLALAGRGGVPDERLADDLWDETDGDRIGRLRVVVSRLRRSLGPAADALVRGDGGYRIAAEVPDLHEADAAAERVRKALRSGDHRGVQAAAAAALARWRGGALADLRTLPFARREGERLDARWLELTVQRLTAELALGAGPEIVGELGELAGRHPLHENLRAMLATALYRAGRQADALAELAALRRALATELGVDPTAEIAELEVRLLRQDPTLRPAPARTAADIRPALARGIVGRRAELTALAARLDAALAGETAVVLAEGGPGAGRTRLLEALADLAAAQGATVHRGRAAAAGAPAFWPWRQALGDRWPAPEAPALLDPDARFGVFEQVTAVLDDAAGPGLVVLLDDLHLADLASLLLLAHVARHRGGSRLLVAATLRPGELSPEQADVRAELLRQPATGRVELGGLTPEAVAEQLALMLGRPCDPAVVADVAARTGGNPLFVQEIGRTLAAGGRGELPGAIRDAVRRQLDALPAPTRTVLAAAAALGGDVEADVLAAATGEPLDEVLDRLDEAVATELLLRGERADRVRFAHEIVREAVRAGTGSGARARLHLRAAEHLEAAGADPDRIAHHRLEALPLGDPAEAVRAATAAADLAVRRFAFEDAVRLYDHALDAGSGLGVGLGLATRAGLLLSRARAQHLGHDVPGAMRSAESAAALAETLDDPELLGRAATVLPDVADAGWLATAGRWCRQALDRLPPGDSPLPAQLLAQLAVASVWADERTGPDDVESTGLAALAMAERVGDTAATVTALRARQLARSGPDGVHDRLDVGARMLRLVPAAGDTAELWGRLWTFDALVQLGRIGPAEEELDRLEPVVARMRQPLARWHLVRNRALLHLARGRFAEARAASDEAVELAHRGGHRAAEYPAHTVRLALATLTGEPIDPAYEEIERYQPPPRLLSMLAARWHLLHGDRAEAERIHALLPRSETVPLKPFMHLLFHSTAGYLAAGLGDDRAADHAYAELLPHAALHLTTGAGAGITEGSVELVLGTIAAARDRPDAAVGHLRAAVAANTAAGLDPFTARARLQLAAALRARGETTEADAVEVDGRALAAKLGMPVG